MKTKLLLSIVTSLISINIVSAQWVQQNSNTFVPYPRFFGVHFTNTTTGFAVGDFGTVRKTNDGGASWHAAAIVGPDALTCVYFINSSTGWVGTATGIFITTNSGTSWTRQEIFDVQSVMFVNSTTGWICGNGGYISRTTNAGTQWTTQTSNTAQNLKSIFFINSLTGWTSGYGGVILKTTNAGANWLSQSSGVTSHLFDICFADANNGKAVGDSGRVRSTINGGANWFAQVSGVPPSKPIYAVDFRPGTSIGWAVGYNNTIICTTNNGTNWLSQTSPVSETFFNVCFPSNLTGYAVGSNGKIIATSTGGFDLSPPTNLTATAVSVSQINLNWNDNSDGEQNFVIERSLTGVFWSQIDVVPANSTSYNNTGLSSNTRYYYRVYGSLPFGNTENSNEANTYTLLITPSPLSPANNSTNQSVTPTLSWTFIAPANNFRLQISFQDINFNNIIFDDSSLTSNSFIVPSGYLGEAKQYYWRIKSKTANTYSLFSSPFTFTTTLYPGPNPCENFSSGMFPPPTMFGEFSPPFYWSGQTPSAYGSGTSSARFDSYVAPLGTSQSLVTYRFNEVPANTYLTFDEAYGPWIGSDGRDSLIILASTNAGGSYTTLASLWGGLGVNAGPLNTVFTGGGRFIPNPNQWASKIYLLPVGTNRIRFKGVSGYGNDIWIDNICIQNLLPPAPASSIALVPQGFFRTGPPQAVRDTVRIYLHRTDFPNIIVDSATSYLLTSGAATSPFSNALSGTYYIVVKHRNSIETWSKAGGHTFSRGFTLNYSFLHLASETYNENVAMIDPQPFYGLYGGDVNQNHNVDASDLGLIDNDAYNFVTGYVRTDLNGDNTVDNLDLIIADNNAFNFVTRQAPPGAQLFISKPKEEDLYISKEKYLK